MRKQHVFPDVNFDHLADGIEIAFHTGSRRIDDFYKRTYPILLREYAKLTLDGSEDDHQRFEACLLLVYSWMGRARLEKLPSIDEYKSACPSLRRMKADGSFCSSDIGAVARLVNGSIVGASKLLHFIAPAFFPIWDQHVARYCGCRAPFSPDLYAEYVGWLRDLEISDSAIELTTRLLDIPPTGQQLRCKEFLLFQAGLARRH